MSKSEHYLFRFKKNHLSNLLCNGTGPLLIFAGLDIRIQGAHNPYRVNAAVFEIAGVLDGDKGLFYMFGNSAEWHRRASLNVQLC